MNILHFSDRLNRIFTIAKSLLEENEALLPIHLFIGACKEGSGVCSELFSYLYFELGDQFINDLCKLSNHHIYDGIQLNGFNVSNVTYEVVKKSEQKMKQYGQIYLNEGHLLSVLLEDEKDLISFLGKNRVKVILSFVASPRDLTVNLKNYAIPPSSKENFVVRKVNNEDFNQLHSFVKEEFGQGWIESIQNGFISSDIPIYIAIEEDRIVGFACFDVVRCKKGLFGPMGTYRLARSKGIGSALLHCCLHEMKSIGYEYVIIGQAGPIEFYEKSCQAKLIPLMK